MAFDYAGIRDGTVIPLMQEFGTTATLQIPAPNTGEPYDPVRGAPTEVTATVLRTKVKSMDRQRLDVEQLDVAYLVSPDGISADPELVDSLVDGGTTYRVVHVETLKPGPTTMLWKLYCRK